MADHALLVVWTCQVARTATDQVSHLQVALERAHLAAEDSRSAAAAAIEVRTCVPSVHTLWCTGSELAVSWRPTHRLPPLSTRRRCKSCRPMWTQSGQRCMYV